MHVCDGAICIWFQIPCVETATTRTPLTPCLAHGSWGAATMLNTGGWDVAPANAPHSSFVAATSGASSSSCDRCYGGRLVDRCCTASRTTDDLLGGRGWIPGAHDCAGYRLNFWRLENDRQPKNGGKTAHTAACLGERCPSSRKRWIRARVAATAAAAAWSGVCDTPSRTSGGGGTAVLRPVCTLACVTTMGEAPLGPCRP